jgi:hypothetical protein
MPGGVGGGSCEASPYPDFFQESLIGHDGFCMGGVRVTGFSTSLRMLPLTLVGSAELLPEALRV